MLLSSLQTLHWIRTGLASSRWPAERLRRHQEFRLRRLLEHAYHEVPFYRESFDRAGFDPKSFHSLADLKRVPILEKSDLKSGIPEQFLVQGVRQEQCQTVHTSGSTGIPLRIFLRTRDAAWQRAAAWRLLFEHGFRWTDRTLEIRRTFGPTFLAQKLGIAPKDWCAILDPPETWARHLVAKPAQVVVASAGTLHALAETVERLDLPITIPRLIISDSETLTPNSRLLIHRVLGRDPIDVYGLVEVSNFAWQCEQRTGLHLSADSHIVQVDAPPGEVGPVIVTDLGMWTMPIIRYHTGDSAVVDPTPCPCGRTLPKLGVLQGRSNDSVLLSTGKRLFWPFFHEVLARYTVLQQWRVEQDTTHAITLFLVIPNLQDQTIDAIRADVTAALPSDMQVRLQRVETIVRQPGEKNRVIVSRLHRERQRHTASNRRA